MANDSVVEFSYVLNMYICIYIYPIVIIRISEYIYICMKEQPLGSI